MSRLLLPYPGNLVRAHFLRREDVFFLDDKGWWAYDSASGKRVLEKLNATSIDWAVTESHSEILKKIDWWSPIWHRWAAHSDQYELLKREALVYVLALQSKLKARQIGNCLFHTGLSHHIETSLVEVACSTLSIPQVFLYTNIIDARLIPLTQVEGIHDRRPYGSDISAWNADEIIASFIENKKQGNMPVHTGMPPMWRVSYEFSILITLYLSLRGIVGRQFRKLTGKGEQDILPGLAAYHVSDYFRIHEQQRQALRFYERNTISQESLAQFKEGMDGPALLMAAHFQPEATTFPEGGAELSNHIDIAVKIRQLGYQGPIFYKEHKASWFYSDPVVGSNRVGVNRSVSYYQQLMDLGCHFLDKEHSLAVDVDNEWYLPVTVTGTIALERSLFGMHTIVTGNPWYKGMPGLLDLEQIDLSGRLDLKYGVVDDDLQAEARRFLSSLLGPRSIANAPGIGTGIPMPEQDQDFLTEMETLVNRLVGDQ